MKIPPVAIIAGVVVVGFVGFKAFTGKSQSSEKAITPPSETEVAQIAQSKIKIRVDGATSMVALNQEIKNQFPGSSISLEANGSKKGLQALVDGKVDVAAVSRELDSEEESKGLVATKVGEDAIAFVVGANNPATDAQFESLKAIFSGKNSDFEPINRPKESATRELVTKALGLNAIIGKTMPRDNTTQMIGMLKQKGIGYATYSQVKDQSTAKVLTVDGVKPDDESYNPLLKRSLYYVTKGQPNGDAKSFIKMAASVAQ